MDLLEREQHLGALDGWLREAAAGQEDHAPVTRARLLQVMVESLEVGCALE